MSEIWDEFTDFCRRELATGGPDPQLALITYLGRDYHPVQRVWLAGCYAAHHCVPSAYAVFMNVDFEWMLNSPQSDVEAWLRQYWDALPVRPEMRSHRMPEKRAKCLQDFALYAHQESWNKPNITFDELWEDSQRQVKYYGRYMAIKYVELLHRIMTNAGHSNQLQSYDIRAKHAWSPRRTLGWLFPGFEATVGNREDNSKETVTDAETLAIQTVNLLKKAGVTVSFFQLQVLLCEFKEFRARGYYPGASHDEEMDYISLVEKDFDMSAVYEARRALFHKEYLGECNNWHGLRENMKYGN